VGVGVSAKRTLHYKKKYIYIYIYIFVVCESRSSTLFKMSRRAACLSCGGREQGLVVQEFYCKHVEHLDVVAGRCKDNHLRVALGLKVPCAPK